MTEREAEELVQEEIAQSYDPNCSWRDAVPLKVLED